MRSWMTLGLSPVIVVETKRTYEPHLFPRTVDIEVYNVHQRKLLEQRQRNVEWAWVIDKSMANHVGSQKVKGKLYHRRVKEDRRVGLRFQPIAVSIRHLHSERKKTPVKRSVLVRNLK